MNIETDPFKQERLQAIIDDRRSGAIELGRQALHTLADYAQILVATDSENLKIELLRFAHALQECRPTMAPMFNLLESWCQWLEAEREPDVERLRKLAFNTALDVVYQSEQASEKIARYVYELVDADSVVMTHSSSSTVLSCFQGLMDKTISAIITQSAPGNEGEHVAGCLAAMAISAQYITDAQLGFFIDKADVVLVGADTILADGSVVNKAGTYLLALAAQDVGIPIYVCAESAKHSPLRREFAFIEEMDPEELQLPRIPHITPRNYYFDITPPELITAWINEHGVQKN